MTEQVHFIPVGFDFERLILPISKGELNADRVVLISHQGEPDDEPTSRAAALAQNMTRRLSNSFDLLDVEVDRMTFDVETLYEYETLYPIAYTNILDELEEGNEVFVNISSMPRTTAFAFATAADSIIAEYQHEVEGIRDRLHTYYVAPEEYLVLDMIETLEEIEDLLRELTDDLRVPEHCKQVQELLQRVEENGVTRGAQDLDGQMYVEFPSSPGSNIESFEQTILNFLETHEPVPSTSELASQLADHLNEEYDESFRSRVQYNVSKLDEKGYVSRKKEGNRLKTELSTMGRMWLETH